MTEESKKPISTLWLLIPALMFALTALQAYLRPFDGLPLLAYVVVFGVSGLTAIRYVLNNGYMLGHYIIAAVLILLTIWYAVSPFPFFRVPQNCGGFESMQECSEKQAKRDYLARLEAQDAEVLANKGVFYKHRQESVAVVPMFGPETISNVKLAVGRRTDNKKIVRFVVPSMCPFGALSFPEVTVEFTKEVRVSSDRDSEDPSLGILVCPQGHP
jgi:hypothetical protein